MSTPSSRHPTSPCSDCPYRTDTPVKKWHRSEFIRTLDADRLPFGDDFACHGHVKLPERERGWCAGWALDQKRRGVPSMRLRMRLIAEPGAGEAFGALSAEGVTLYPTVAAMCRANGVRGRR
jgi:hypothetical protein